MSVKKELKRNTRLNQLEITSFFGKAKNKLILRRKSKKARKTFSTIVIEISDEEEEMNDSTACAKEDVQKRKLPIPLSSSDEENNDSDNKIDAPEHSNRISKEKPKEICDAKIVTLTPKKLKISVNKDLELCNGEVNVTEHEYDSFEEVNSERTVNILQDVQINNDESLVSEQSNHISKEKSKATCDSKIATSTPKKLKLSDSSASELCNEEAQDVEYEHNSSGEVTPERTVTILQDVRSLASDMNNTTLMLSKCSEATQNVPNHNELPTSPLKQTNSPSKKTKRGLLSLKKLSPDNISDKTTVSSSSSQSSCSSRSKLNNSMQSLKENDETYDGDAKINLKNLELFKELIERVLSKRSLNMLLFNEELQTIKDFMQMKTDFQYLCFKLFTYKMYWYNLFKICKRSNLSNILGDAEIIEIYNCLQKKKFIDTDVIKDETLEVLLSYVESPDMRKICDSFRIKHQRLNKQDMILQLLRCCKTQSTLSPLKSTTEVLKEHVRKKLGFCLKINRQFYNTLYKTYSLCTFTNPEYIDPMNYFSNMSYLQIVFPECQIHDCLPFDDANQYNRFHSAILLKKDFQNALDAKHSENMLRFCEEAFNRLKSIPAERRVDKSVPSYLRRFSDEYQYISVVSSGAKEFYTTEFVKVDIWLQYLTRHYDTSHRLGMWLKILLRVQSYYLKNYDEAAEMIIEAFRRNQTENIFSDVDLHELSEKVEGIKKTVKYKISQLNHDTLSELAVTPCDTNTFPFVTIDAQTVRSNISGKKRNYLLHDSDGEKTYTNVENIALNYYIKNGFTDGSHCEGSLITALFCLYFWDIIYEENVPMTFVTSIQEAPLDMHSSHFYENRKDSIDARLKDIAEDWSDAETKTFLKKNWNYHAHEASLVKIDSIISDTKILLTITSCIDRVVLSRIFKRLLSNFRLYRSGFPDLFLWNTDTKKSKFVEVKGEGDHLSTKQKLWIIYLMDIGADVEVCHVHSLGSKRKKKLSFATKAV